MAIDAVWAAMPILDVGPDEEIDIEPHGCERYYGYGLAYPGLEQEEEQEPRDGSDGERPYLVAPRHRAFLDEIVEEAVLDLSPSQA